MHFLPSILPCSAGPRALFLNGILLGPELLAGGGRDPPDGRPVAGNAGHGVA